MSFTKRKRSYSDFGNKKKDVYISSPITYLSSIRSPNRVEISAVETTFKDVKIDGTDLTIVQVDKNGEAFSIATVGDILDVDKFEVYLNSIKDIFKNNEKFTEDHIHSLIIIFEYIKGAKSSPDGLQLDSWAASEDLLSSLRNFCKGNLSASGLGKKLDELRTRFKNNRNVNIGTGMKEVLANSLFTPSGLLVTSGLLISSSAPIVMNIQQFYDQLTLTLHTVTVNLPKFTNAVAFDEQRTYAHNFLKTNSIGLDLLKGEGVKTTNQVFNLVTNFMVRIWDKTNNLLTPLMDALSAATKAAEDATADAAAAAAEAAMKSAAAAKEQNIFMRGFNSFYNYVAEGIYSVVDVIKSKYNGDEQIKISSIDKSAFDETMESINNLTVSGAGLSDTVLYMTVALGVTAVLLSTYTLKRYLDARQIKSKILYGDENADDDDEIGVIQTFGYI